MFEHTTGPFSGYWVATYACEMGELGSSYLGISGSNEARP